MFKMLLLTMLMTGIHCCSAYAQKKYGYISFNFRCGDNDPQRDRIYFSPVIELNTLNFQKYTEGMDPGFVPFSVQYYNYAMGKWFEAYLREHYKVFTNESGKYARRSTTVIYHEGNEQACNDDKTISGCFYLSKDELELKRKHAIAEARDSQNSSSICEVIDLY